MPRETNYTLAQIRKNLTLFDKKMKEKGMDQSFWVIADRSDFQPLKKISKQELDKRMSKKSSKNTSKKSSKTQSKNTSKKTSKKSSKKSSKKMSRLGSKKTKPQPKVNIHSIKELKDNFLSGKEEYYKDKKFANIKITVNENVLNKVSDIKNYKDIKDEVILTVHVIVFKIGPTGSLNFYDKSELKVKYVVDDFRNLNFKLKNIEVLMRLVADSVIKSNSVSGISYKHLLEKINKKQK